MRERNRSPESEMTRSAKAKKSRSKTGKKAEYLDNRDLALRIQGPGGFEKVKAEVGERLDPIRASRILKLLKDEYGYAEKDIDKGLRELAAKKRSGHIGGPVTPPKDGEERVYKVGKNKRIGTPVGILDDPNEVRVKFTKQKIVITPK